MDLAVDLAAEDIGNVRFLISPIAHLALGVPADTGSAARWWRGVRRHAPTSTRHLIELLVAHPWYVPEFLTPTLPASRADDSRRFDEELEAVAATSPEQILEELQPYRAHLEVVPRAVAELSEGGSRAWAGHIKALRDLYRTCLAEEWPEMARRLRADVAFRAAQMAEAGSSAMLTGLHPALARVAALRVEHSISTATPKRPERQPDFQSQGRGLFVAPNLLLDGKLAVCLSNWRQPLFCYTASYASPPRAGGGADALALLLGRGRAGALRAIEGGCTTNELAERIASTAGTASVHATRLRDAGLVTTTRNGQRVLHSLTVLGAALLDANPARRRPR